MVDKNELKKIALFASLDGKEIESLANCMTVKSVYKGGLVFPEDTAGGILYAIKGGEVKISHLIREGERQQFNTLCAGESFGSVSLLDGQEHSASAEAISDCILFELQKKDFDSFAEEFPRAGLKVLNCILVSLCSFVRAMDKKFVDMVQYITLDR